MTRDQRKEIVEAIGLIAIVASLIFLALEIRQSNLATMIAARDNAAQGHMDYLGMGLDSSVFARAYSKPDTEELSLMEQRQIRRYHAIRWRHYDRLYFLYKSGIFSEAEWSGYKRAIANVLNSTGRSYEFGQDVWRYDRDYLSPDFVNYVDSEIRLVE